MVMRPGALPKQTTTYQLCFPPGAKTENEIMHFKFVALSGVLVVPVQVSDCCTGDLSLTCQPTPHTIFKIMLPFVSFSVCANINVSFLM